MILCDDLGYGDLACFGHPVIRTPHLDRLAAEGLRFTQCYAAAPVCSSSRAGLMTGRTPSRVGVYDWIPQGNVMHLRREEITVATLLRRAGYATIHAGKWHLNGRFNQPEQPQPGDHGFDHWLSTQNNAAPNHENPTNFVRNGKPVGPLEGYSCQIVADETIRWLRARDAAKPFFAFVCFHEPHEVVAAPPALVEKYEKAGATKKGEATYYACVENMDSAAGRLLAALDELGLADNTLVLFTSDNGPETLNRYPNAWRSHGSPGPLRGMKLWLYEGGIRVPGIVRWKSHTPVGKVSAEPVCGLDVLPTLCELAGVEPPRDRAIDGSSFAALVDGKSAAAALRADASSQTRQPGAAETVSTAAIRRHTPLFWHYFNALGEPKAALRVGSWMVLGHVERGNRMAVGNFNASLMPAIKSEQLTQFELYDLGKDPSQKRDLAADEPQRLAELSAALKKKFAEVQAEAPVWVESAAPGKKPANRPRSKRN